MRWSVISTPRRAAWIGGFYLLSLFACSSRLASSLDTPVQAADASTQPAVDAIDLPNLQAAFQSTAQRVAPAVVAISASTTPDDSPASLRTQEFNADTLQDFLSKTTRMVGAGFFIDADGYILTNDHVIDDAAQLWVTTDDRKVYPALVVGSDPRSDLAVLKIPAHGMPTVHFATAPIQRGEWSVAIGNPFGLCTGGEMSVSVGIVSAVNRSLPKLSEKENRSYYNLIQTTAQINPGNSGGPLVDLHGDVVGINTAVVLPQKSTNGIGFAIPIDDHLLAVAGQLKQGKEIVYAYLGITVTAPTDEQLKIAGLKQSAGVTVLSVQANSPASTGQLQQNDLIMSIDGKAVPRSDDFAAVISAASTIQPVTISLIRQGHPTSVTLMLSKRQQPVDPITRDTQKLRWAGMLLGSAGVDHSAGLKVLAIDAASPFNRFGLHAGSIITSVAGRSIEAMTDLQTIINETPITQCNLGIAPDSTASADLPAGN